MEEEARQILKAELQEEPKREENLAESIRRKIEPLDGVEFSTSPASARSKARLYVMIVLDTNVVSEVLKPSPSQIALGWLAAQYPRGGSSLRQSRRWKCSMDSNAYPPASVS